VRRPHRPRFRIRRQLRAAHRGAGMTEPAIVLLAFGGTKNILGGSELQFPVAAPCTASELLDEICSRYPALVVQRQSLRLAINGVYAGWGQCVSPGDEVALIPPVTGG